MIGLILFTIVGVVLFAAFLAIGLQGTPKNLPDSSAVSAVSQMVSLEGPSLMNPRRLLDDGEYQMLLSNPELQQVAKRLRKERQELAILWISTLLSDLSVLWRFRRFLIRRGVAAGFREEFGILQSFVLSVVFLNLLKISIHAFGPFVLSRMIRDSGSFVDKMSYSAASVLGRVPQAGWPEIERNWIRSAA